MELGMVSKGEQTTGWIQGWRARTWPTSLQFPSQTLRSLRILDLNVFFSIIMNIDLTREGGIIFFD